MTTFKNSPEYREIVKFCKERNILDKEAIFQCYVDGMFDYKLLHGNKEYYLTFIFEDENLVCEQSIEWLLDLKTIKYFNFRYNEEEITFNINENLN
jgi:hypothetical protein